MTINLSQKQRLMLEDQKKHEELCIQKYTAYASQAQDAQLQQIFNTHAQQEQQHLNTLNQILAGQVPNTQSQSQQQGQQNQQSQQGQAGQLGMQGMQTFQMQSQPPNFNQAQYGQGQPGMGSAASVDAILCNDLLVTEKFVSGTYDTAIFEMADTNVRQALNHIQKEEQQHGEDLMNYMQSRNMYNPGQL